MMATHEIEPKPPISDRVERLKRELFGNDLLADEVAMVLDIDPQTVRRYLHRHVLIGYKIGNEWRVPAEEIVAFRARLLEQNRNRRSEAEQGNDDDESPDELVAQ